MRIVNVLVISGSMGSGKTTLMGEISDLLTAGDICHAAIELDTLALGHLPARAEHLQSAHLAAMWQRFAALEVLTTAGQLQTSLAKFFVSPNGWNRDWRHHRASLITSVRESQSGRLRAGTSPGSNTFSDPHLLPQLIGASRMSASVARRQSTSHPTHTRHTHPTRDP